MSDNSVAKPSKRPSPGDGAFFLSVFLGIFFFPAILGVIMGFRARGRAKREKLAYAKATAAIVIGFLWIAFWVFMYFLGSRS